MMPLPLPDITAANLLLEQLISQPPVAGPCPIDRPLVLYGAGKMGHLAADLLRRLDLPVEYAVDRSPPPNRLLANRIPVMKPEEVPPEHRSTHRIAVCVVFSPYEPIRASLTEMGWLHITPFYDIAEAYVDRVPMGNGWFCGPLDPEETEKVRLVLSRWDDDYSRAAHLQFLAWRMHRKEWVFNDAPITIDDRFFITPILRLLSSEECFLDCGAYHGTVTEDFLKHVKAKCRGIIAIEPDKVNSAALRQSLSKLRLDDGTVKILQCALGKSTALLPFQEGMQLASRLDRRGTQEVEVRTLDEINPHATFVKLHLEGGELDALHGGMTWLRNCRPILTVTVYHHRDGIFKIPEYLMNHLPEYRFLLRNHAWCGTGVVLYGVPEERFKKHHQ